MSLKFQLQREVILDNLEAALTEYTKELFGKEIEEFVSRQVMSLNSDELEFF